MALVPIKIQGQRIRSFTLILLIGLFLGLGYFVYNKDNSSKTAPPPQKTEQEEVKKTENENPSPLQEKKKENSEASQEENLSVYQNKIANFEVKYPSSWKIINTGPVSISFSSQTNIENAADLNDKNILATFAYLPIMGDVPSSISAWVEKNNNSLLSGTEIKERKETQIGGAKAVCQKIDSRKLQNASGGISYSCYVLKGDKIISLSYLAKNEETFNAAKETFNKVIESVKFLQ